MLKDIVIAIRAYGQAHLFIRQQIIPTTIIKFLSEKGKTILSMISPQYNDTGTMIGNADVKTFHNAAFENLK